jgi:hypothetical protein
MEKLIGLLARIAEINRVGRDWVIATRTLVAGGLAIGITAGTLVLAIIVPIAFPSAELIAFGPGAPATHADVALLHRAEGILHELGYTGQVAVSATACGGEPDGVLAAACSVSTVRRLIVVTPGLAALSDGTLRVTLAHEAVHQLTSDAETAWLDAHKSSWRADRPGWNVPVEIVADCGAPLLLQRAGYALADGSNSAGAYVNTCTPDETTTATAVINNTLLSR